ncbi:MAG: HEPN domain-containing protein [Solirubrobacteraceae bacterium]
MLTPEHIEVADLLLQRASDDLVALRVLARDEEQADHVVGFHAQQTVEKALKAALAMLEIEIPRTHELAYVLSLLDDSEAEVPETMARAEWLTPWAGGLRYEEVASPIDRRLAVALAETSLGWARSFVDARR